MHEQLNPQPTNGPTVNFNGNNSGNAAIGRDVTQTTNPVTVPGPAENTLAATATSSEIKAGKNTGFWEKLRAFAAGTSGLIALVATVVIAVFTVLMWLIMSR